MLSEPVAIEIQIIFMLLGYSAKQLPQKLGIKPGDQVVILNAPRYYPQLLGELPEGSSVINKLGSSHSFIHFFVSEYAELVNTFPTLKKALKVSGQLWISWPKKTSKLKSDLNENTIREIGLENGLVDVKVAAIDEDWSALKFVYRLKDRS